MSERLKLQRIVRILSELDSAVADLCCDDDSFVVADRMHEEIGDLGLQEFVAGQLSKLRSEIESRIGEIND